MLCTLIFWASTVVLAYNLVVYLLERLEVGSINEKAVLITGCDSGFGHGLVFKCLQNQMTVFAGCLTDSGKAELEKEAKRQKLNAKFHAIKLDVTKDESVKQAVDYVKEALKGKGLHALVNNAGIAGQNGWDDWMTLDSYRICWEVNTLGLIRMTHAFKPLIKKSKGRIVNTASICGRISLPCTAPYNVSKYGVEAYSDAIRAELSVFGITVCILEPGFFATGLTNANMHKAMLDKMWNALSSEVREEYGEHMLEFSKNQAENELQSLCSKDTYLVVDAYYHALTSFWPRRRYQVGYDSIFFFLPFSFLPGVVQDNFFKLMSIFKSMPKPSALK
ncbi:hypothetical protein M3Y97_00920900 [Aphelenchoides bicaudatus]|nr:hypothetical protein M3Y97_00920900 [Aphelenchoides bicaudatus]